MIRHVRTLTVVTLLGASSIACSSNDPAWVVPSSTAEATGEKFTFSGTVRHSELEGGFYYIEGPPDGTKYNPTNLPTDFQKEGLAVEVEARKRNDMVGIHQAGPIIDVERIRVR